MARKHNPFAEREASVLQTPWGDFKVAAPNKERLSEISALQKDVEAAESDTMQSAELGIRSVAAGLEDGESFRVKALAAWDAGDLNLAQIRSAAEFVSEEIQGEVEAGND